MRSEKFEQKKHARYWWFHQIQTSYVPPIFSFLSDKEWRIMEEWYGETDELNWTSECNVTMISFLQGIIMGSSIRNIVQLGTHAGFSTLLLGFMMKKMSFANSFVTIDNDPALCSVAQHWVNKSELNNYVKILKSDSTHIDLPKNIRQEFDNEPINLLFINCSSQYRKTLEELDFWYEHIADRGFIIIHNANNVATKYDTTNEGGINRALYEWSLKTGRKYFVINDSLDQGSNYHPLDLVYRDLGGFAIIQK